MIYYEYYKNMKRCLIENLSGHTSESVCISGKIAAVRDHGKVLFIDMYDRSGVIQCFVPGSHSMFAEAQKFSPESVLTLQGKVQERPEKNRTEGQNGDIEFVAEEITILAKAQELPFDFEMAELNLDTRFDYRPLTLRRADDRALFRVQALITQGFRDYLTSQGFVEFQAPKIVGGDAEGGAEVFPVDYFDIKASLATSPQLYKQILVGVFERVFCIGNVFRAEKHSTSRHLNEYTSMDFEMGYITDHTDVTAMLEGCVRHIITMLGDGAKKEIDMLASVLPVVPEKPFPLVKLVEAQEIIKTQFGDDCVGEPDLSPEHERLLCEYALKEHNSDFIFVTHYPTAKRPWYTYDDEDDPGYTKSFDLLFRGVEITSGGQRVHDHTTLVQKIKEKLPNIDPEKEFGFYLQAFKYGIPPHGGMGLGLERLTAKMVGLANTKEAAIFPRDRNRIDVRLYEQ